MNSPYFIRKARPQDAEKLPEVERSAARSFLSVPGLGWIAEDTVQSAEYHLAFMADGHAWVAVDERDEPVGFVNAEVIGDSLHIWECAVRFDCQQCGIGRELVEQAKAGARQEGIAAVSQTTFSHVVWNRPFYEQLGFRALTDNEIPAYLVDILKEEAAHGIPMEQRCAMVCRLDSLTGA